jgi:predicted phosphodiesterase
MHKYLIISDLHFGLKRKAGATPQSMVGYADFQFQSAELALQEYHAQHLLIAGDLFAAGQVDYATLWRTAELLRKWGGDIYCLQGNHDIIRDRTQMPALQFLAKMLGPRFTLIDEPMLITDDIAVVPHLPNQEAYDAAVAEAAQDALILVTHANFENPFAQGQDHSLNLTAAQAAEFELVLNGHEHAPRVVGNVQMLGSLVPCQPAEANIDHFAWLWDGETPPMPVPSACPSYEEQNWYELIRPEALFVKVVGEAEAGEAATVIQEISQFRQDYPDVFMVANAVKVGDLVLGELTQAAEDLDMFDPLAAILSALSEEHRGELKKVLGKEIFC